MPALSPKPKAKKLHKKPSTEELNASLENIDDELAKAQAEDEGGKPEPKKKVVKKKKVKPAPVEPDLEPEPEPSKEIIKDMLKREKEKGVASQQESLVLYSKNKKTNEALEEAMLIPDPTEEEMITEWPDWEMMSDFEKKMAKESTVNKRRMGKINEIVKDNKSLTAWQGKVDTFLGDPETLTKNPKLEGKAADFKLFATKPTRRGVDLQDLVSAFLFEEGSSMLNKKTKRAMFESGSGGPSEKPKPKSGKISIEQAAELRKTNYPKYKEYVTAGKIDTSDV